MTRDTSHVALHGALSAGGLGAAGAEHLGVDPVADQQQHQGGLRLQRLQVIIWTSDTRLVSGMIVKVV